jgi:hypothetical protein
LFAESVNVWLSASAESVNEIVAGVASSSCDWTISGKSGASRIETPLTTGSVEAKLSKMENGCRNST